MRELKKERSEKLRGTSKSKALAKKSGYSEHEKNILKQEREMVRDRARRVKAGGFKSESDYFRNVNPFTGKRRGS